MYGILFKVEAKPGKRQEWIDHIKWVFEVAKQKEPATLRFEMYTDPNDDNVFLSMKPMKTKPVLKPTSKTNRTSAGIRAGKMRQ